MLFRLFSSRIRGGDAQLYQKIRQWINQLNPENIPKKDIEWSFSRSRGPGGQNVNKVNSKAELRMNVKSSSWIPSEMISSLPSTLIFKSDQFRNQVENQQACLRLLSDHLEETAIRVAPPPTDQEQIARVERLKRSSDQRRLFQKKIRSDIKSGRNAYCKFE